LGHIRRRNSLNEVAHSITNFVVGYFHLTTKWKTSTSLSDTSLTGVFVNGGRAVWLPRLWRPPESYTSFNCKLTDSAAGVAPSNTHLKSIQQHVVNWNSSRWVDDDKSRYWIRIKPRQVHLTTIIMPSLGSSSCYLTSYLNENMKYILQESDSTWQWVKSRSFRALVFIHSTRAVNWQCLLEAMRQHVLLQTKCKSSFATSQPAEYCKHADQRNILGFFSWRSWAHILTTVVLFAAAEGRYI
jgi:hypothetical protein